MGKGKKKTKGKKRSGGKKVREDDTNVNVDDSSRLQITPEQYEKAREAAANRTEDPLKNWTRLQNEECPICMLPLPFALSENRYWGCCGKMICWGCIFNSGKSHVRNGGVKDLIKMSICPFCREDGRESTPAKEEYELKRIMKQAETGEHDDMGRIGEYYFDGQMGLKQDKAEGLKWYHRAVEAGSGRAAFSVGMCYYEGDGVDKDDDKALEYLQKAAELDFIPAFYVIGSFNMNIGEVEKGMLNYRKAAMCGYCDDWLFDLLREGFKDGYITKDEYAYTLRENQKACNEMKSDGRDAWKIMLSKGVLQRAGGM